MTSTSTSTTGAGAGEAGTKRSLVKANTTREYSLALSQDRVFSGAILRLCTCGEVDIYTYEAGFLGVGFDGVAPPPRLEGEGPEVHNHVAHRVEGQRYIYNWSVKETMNEVRIGMGGKDTEDDAPYPCPILKRKKPGGDRPETKTKTQDDSRTASHMRQIESLRLQKLL